MSMHNPSNKSAPAAHIKMLKGLVKDGLLKVVGDSHEMTDAGHDYTRALISARLNPPTSEGNTP